MNRFCTLIATLVLGAVAPCVWADASYSSVILTDGPAGYWRLGEDASSPIASDASGNAVVRNGFYSRGVTSGASGAIHGDPDTAAAFDGQTSFVVVLSGTNTTSSTNPFNLPNGFSVEAWMINNGPSDSTVVGRWMSTRVLPPAGPANGSSAGWGVGTLKTANSSAPVDAVRFTTFGVKDYDSAATIVPQDGAWHHVVTVLDSTNAVTFYLDGQFTDFIQGTSPARSSPNDLNIGRNPVPSGNPGPYEMWNGSIDECAFYNYELTSDQVLAHYMAGIR
jgi:hypothetical protein